MNPPNLPLASVDGAGEHTTGTALPLSLPADDYADNEATKPRSAAAIERELDKDAESCLPALVEDLDDTKAECRRLFPHARSVNRLPGSSVRDDGGAARVFARMLGAGSERGALAAWPHSSREPYVFSEGRWEQSSARLWQLWRVYCRASRAGARWSTTAATKAVMEALRHEAGIACGDDVFDQDPYLLGVANGVVDLRTGELVPAEPGHYVSKFCAASYDSDYVPGADGQAWLDGNAWALANDPGALAWLQVFMGSTLLGRVSMKALLYIWGQRHSGKSTLTNVVTAALGDYAVGALDIDAIGRRVGSFGDRFGSTALEGVRLAVCPEMTSALELDIDRIKAFTGEAMMTVRKMRADPYQAKITASLVLQGNANAVRSAAGDRAFADRLRIVKFTRRREGGDDDPGARERFIASEDVLSTALGWMVQGCRQFLATGEAPQTAGMVAAKGEYVDTNDQVGCWLRETGAQEGVPERTADWPTRAEARRAFIAWRMADEEESDDTKLSPKPPNPKRFIGELREQDVPEAENRGRRVGLRIGVPAHTLRPPF